MVRVPRIVQSGGGSLTNVAGLVVSSNYHADSFWKKSRFRIFHGTNMCSTYRDFFRSSAARRLFTCIVE